MYFINMLRYRDLRIKHEYSYITITSYDYHNKLKDFIELQSNEIIWNQLITNEIRWNLMKSARITEKYFINS